MEGRRNTERTWTATMLVALAGVLCLIVAGAIALSSDGPQTATAGPPVLEPSFGAEPVEPVSGFAIDSVLVDALTGDERPVPDAFGAFEAARGFTVSPDGSTVAFTSLGHLFLSTPDGSDVRPIESGAEWVGRPSWSGDSSHLVYVGADGTGGNAVYVLDVASESATRAVAVDRWYQPAPSLDRDGSTVLFTALGDGKIGLWTAPVAGGRPRLLIPGGAYGAFSPDGQRIAYLGGSYHRSSDDLHVYLLHIARADGTDETLVRSGLAGSIGINGEHWEFTRPTWSPDGRWIALAPDTSVSAPSTGNSTGEILVIDAETGARVSRFSQGFWPTWIDARTVAVRDDA